MIKSVRLFNFLMILMFISLNGQNPLQTKDYKNKHLIFNCLYKQTTPEFHKLVDECLPYGRSFKDTDWSSTFISYYEEDDYYSYDLREPPRKIIHPDKIKKTNKTYATTDDWTNIPYYPTIKERQEQQRLQPSTSVPNLQNQYQYVQNQQVYIQRPVTSHNYPHHAHTYSHHQNQQPQQHRHNKQAPHIFSPEYANYVGAKPRAQPSAKIGLGGVKK